ncbi:hypothetical protein MPSI1_003449 [Malassezia psittaci]|uniref:DUF3533 domain-containing protein n=1 Tax=Malassezia psittaci TaxID=1821823 RepID=A0AAF0F8T6_9BASI|nr:hypothetical protein MPSI1_003449 [Malassezia psittaci]
MSNAVTAQPVSHSENGIQPPVSNGREPLNYRSSLGGSENNQPQSIPSHTAGGQAQLSNSPTSGNVGSSGQNTLQDDKERNGQNTSKAGGEKQGKPNVQPFEHGFWDPSLKQLRAIYFKPVIMTTVLMMVIVWGFLSIYWGSLWKEQDLSPNLQVMVVNYDSGDIGQSIVQALNQSNYGARPHPTYVFLEPSEYPDDTAIMNAIEPNELYWGAVHIMQDATNRLTTARANGDASWNPSAVVTITTATARNYAVVPSIVLSPTQSTLSKAIASLNARLTGDFVSASASNQGVLTAAARAPQTLGNPVGLTVREIRPWDVPVAIAPTFVGLIYLVILTFQITMASFGARQPIQKFLTLRSIIAMRILTPVLSYIPISLMYTLLNIPFKLPYGATFPYGGGVMVWWCVSYTGMLVLGLAMESMITIVGVKFIGIFMVFFIVSNVSVANFPPALSPSFYKYGYAMPFYNLRQIYLTILFNVGKRVWILKYVGILWAWLALIFLTFPIVIWYDHRKRHHDWKNQLSINEGPS